MTMAQAEPKKLTGRKVLLIAVAFFGVILAVNMTLLFSAVSTFPGLETNNSYVDSQTFDQRAREQAALGWTPSVAYEDGFLVLNLTQEDGTNAMPVMLKAKIGRPTHAAEDQEVAFQISAQGHRARVDLTPGPWRVFVSAEARDGTVYDTRLNLLLPES